MDNTVAFIIVVGGLLALALTAVVLFTVNCIDKRQHQEEVAVGAAVVAAVGVAAIALTILDGGHRARDARPQHQGGRSTTAAADRPECALCLGVGELEAGEEWVVLTMCPHEFHRKCLAGQVASEKRELLPHVQGCGVARCNA